MSMKKALLGLAGMLAVNGVAAAAGKVLLVQSYHAGYEWVDAIDEGVKETLKAADAQLEIFYMDTKRKTSPEWKVESGKLAKAKVDEYKPDVVITADDNAQEFFAKDYAGKAGAPQIVFCGVNAEPSKYGFPAENVTGILERAHLVDSIKMLQQISKDVKKVVILTDNSETSDGAVAYFKQLKLPAEVVAYEQPGTLDQWKAAVAKAQEAADAIGVFMYHTVKKAEGGQENAEPKDIMAWTVANSKKPVFAVMPFGVADGALCGIVESGQEHGVEAAKMALQCIGGAKAGSIKIDMAHKGEVMINVKTAEEKGFDVPFELIQTASKVIGK